MKKKNALIIGTVLLVIAIGFVVYAVNHPEASFPWSNQLTFLAYGVYVFLIFKFLIVIPFCKQQSGSLLSVFIYLMVVIMFILTEINNEMADIYTILRGFVIIGGIDIAVGNLYWYGKRKYIKRNLS